MAKLQEMLNAQVNTEIELHEEASKLQRWGFLTSSQATALRQHAAPALPCTLVVNMRTRKGVVYVNAIGSSSLSFALSPRAKLI